jgi:hypothetical protein
MRILSTMKRIPLTSTLQTDLPPTLTSIRQKRHGDADRGGAHHEGFKGYEAWLEPKNNKEKLRENALKLLSMMADYPRC